MKKTDHKTVKRIFLFFIFYLPFQYMLVGIVGVVHSEPWPAFVLPGFKNVYGTQNEVETTKAQFYVEWDESPGRRQEIAVENLFEGLQASQTQGFLKSNFSDPSVSYTQDARNWLKERLKQLYPDSTVNSLQVEWTTITYLQAGESVRINSSEHLKTINIQL